VTVPILRDVSLSIPPNDAAVLGGAKPVVSAWCGRAGAAATVTYTMAEITPGGTQGSFGGSMPAVAGATGLYRATLTNTLPGRYYRLTVRAEDPGLATDNVIETYQFTSTPG
jgi:hypothetical protein